MSQTTRITRLMFAGTDLDMLDIPNSIMSIGDYSFQYCTSLTSIVINDSVTSIGEWAFSGCTSLTNVTIPESVTSIEYGAFYNCSSLTRAIVRNPNAKFGNLVFSDVSLNFELYGYTGSTAEKYANANGYTFVSID